MIFVCLWESLWVFLHVQSDIPHDVCFLQGSIYSFHRVIWVVWAWGQWALHLLFWLSMARGQGDPNYYYQKAVQTTIAQTSSTDDWISCWCACSNEKCILTSVYLTRRALFTLPQIGTDTTNHSDIFSWFPRHYTSSRHSWTAVHIIKERKISPSCLRSSSLFPLRLNHAIR